SVLVPEVTEDHVRAAAPDGPIRTRLRALKIVSWLVVPLAARGKTVGTVSLFAAGSGRRFAGTDLALAEELARRAGVALDTRQPVALGTVLKTATETAQPLLDARRHTLAVDAPDAPVWVHADPARLTQVFGNLLTNAAKYMEDGGEVTVTVELIGRVARTESS